MKKFYYDTIVKKFSIVNLISSSFGTLLPINPKINVTKNQKVIFDLSDASLSQPFGVGRTASFDFDLFSDQNLLFETKVNVELFEYQFNHEIKFSPVFVFSKQRIFYKLKKKFLDKNCICISWII